MRGARTLMWVGSILVISALAINAQAYEAPKMTITDNDRLVDNYNFDAAVVPQGRLRLEIHGFTGQNRQSSDGPQVLLRGFPAGNADNQEIRLDVRKVTGGIIGLRGSYGVIKNAEIGFDVTGILQHLSFATEPTEDAQDMGDTFLWGKYKYDVTSEFAMTGGFELRVPTGQEHKRLGTGDVGMNPFVSTRYNRGHWAVGGHVGYQINSEEPTSASFAHAIDNVYNWDIDGLVRVAADYALRAEISGRHYNYGHVHIDDVYAVPSIEYNYSKNMTFRPFGLAGITGEAWDWGLGLGIAMTFF